MRSVLKGERNGVEPLEFRHRPAPTRRRTVPEPICIRTGALPARRHGPPLPPCSGTADGTFPENHPVSLKFFNPRGQERITAGSPRPGRTVSIPFPWRRATTNPTGTWIASLTARRLPSSRTDQDRDRGAQPAQVLLETKPRELGPGDRPNLSRSLSPRIIFSVAPAPAWTTRPGFKVFSRRAEILRLPSGLLVHERGNGVLRRGPRLDFGQVGRGRKGGALLDTGRPPTWGNRPGPVLRSG